MLFNFIHIRHSSENQSRDEREREREIRGRKGEQAERGGWWKEADTAYVPFGFPDPALSSF